MQVVTIKELHPDDSFSYDMEVIVDKKPEKEKETSEEEDYQRRIAPRLEER